MLDMQMPEMDGLAIARAIKTDAALAAARLILLTPFGTTFTQHEQRNFGIAALCSKPVHQSTLLACFSNAMMADDLTPNGIQSTTSTVLTSSASLQNRILIVEDNQTNQLVALSQPRTLGCAPDIAATDLRPWKLYSPLTMTQCLWIAKWRTWTGLKLPLKSAVVKARTTIPGLSQ
jgi:two-component system, sensor histidine kinase and response regulator